MLSTLVVTVDDRYRAPRGQPLRESCIQSIDEDGVAEVVGDGRVVATLGPGEAFGEIALLRRVPRTATVRARTDLRLESLTSERFLPVVTGFRSSADQATAHVDALLSRFAPQPRPPVPLSQDG